MINLLPQTEKSNLDWDKRKKIIIINWSLALLFFIFIISGLLFIDMYIAGQVEVKKNALSEEEKNYQRTGLKDFQKEISKFNGGLEKIKQFYIKKKYVSNVLEKIAPLITENGISIKTFSFSTSFKAKVSYYNIAITGFAPNREGLFNFKKQLEKEDNFSEIVFPQENWVKPVNIDFVVNMLVK